ncbi:FAD-dependent oxidoreductase [Promicromonospora sp. Populi]|uniref:FAD-binding oxidoreductase n=1 Tax=Promicromonospora sp. Populi TaxID=3239420 RepID=UPI0034E2591A
MTLTTNPNGPLAEGAFADPGTPEYDEAAVSFNLAAPLRPIAATTARTVADAQNAILEAGEIGARIAPISTGHSTSMLGPVASKLYVVRTVLDEPIRVDPGRGTVWIPAGARWGAVVDAAAEHGFAVPHGSSPTVGVIGFLLGGGLSFYGRQLGVAANSVVSVTLALADGGIVTADANNDPELFRAVRGGGGGFGIVLGVELRMLPLRTVLTGMIVWDAAESGPVARAWADWAATAPRAATTSMRLLNLPPGPMTPEPLQGRQILAIDGSIIVDDDAPERAGEVLRDLVDPLSALATPLLDTWHVGPVTDAVRTHGDPEDPLPGASDSFSLAGVGHDTIDRWYAAAGPGSGSRLIAAELRQLGGAFAEAPAGAGVFGSIEADLASFGIGLAITPEDHKEVRADLERLRESLRPYTTDRTAPTLIENPATPRRTFSADVEAQVDAVRARVDPEGLFSLDARRSSGL